MEREDLPDTLKIAGVAGNQNSSQLPARVGKEDVEDKTSRCRVKSDALVLDQPRKGLTESFPGSRRWVNDTTTFVIRLEDGVFQVPQIARTYRTGSQLGGDDRAEVHARSGRLDKGFQQRRFLIASRCGDETIRIQYELAHRDRINRFGRDSAFAALERH